MRFFNWWLEQVKNPYIWVAFVKGVILGSIVTYFIV